MSEKPTKVKSKTTETAPKKTTTNKPESKKISGKKRKINTSEPGPSRVQPKKSKSETKPPPPKPSKKRPKQNNEEDADLEEWVDDTGGQVSTNVPTFDGKFGLSAVSKVDPYSLDTSHHNFIYLVVDEICLEGLDGITLEALWTRISFTLKYKDPLPNTIRNIAWNIIRSTKDVEFFKLQEPRQELKIYDRYKDRDAELGEVIDPVEAPLDIYPFCPVKEFTALGSCSSFETRVDVSDEVRLLQLEEVDKSYGSRLVLVGTQRSRKKAIVHALADPNVEFSSIQYSLLERIGRARTFGEITQGKISLQVISKDPKTLFYNRKILSENNLITKQPFNIKTPTGSHLSGTLLHLYRFYNEQKTKTQIMTQQIVEVLRNKPGYRIEYSEAKEIFGHTLVLRKLFKLPEFQRFVKTDMPCFCRDLYPNDPSKWNTASNKERVVRTLELANPDVNVSGAWNEEEAKDESSDEEVTQELMYKTPILHQVYDFIKLGGREGRSIKDILSNKGLDFYSTRAAINQLVNLKLVDGVKIDIGRQRQIKYRTISFRPYNLEVTNPEIEREKEQLEVEAINFLSDLLDVEPSYLASPHIPQQPDLMVPDDNYALIRKLRQQNKQKKENTECMAILMATYKNEHGYTHESNAHTFNSDINLPSGICQGVFKSLSKQLHSDFDSRRRKLTKFLSSLKQKNASDVVDVKTLYGDLGCPLKYEGLTDDETYRKLLHKTVNLSQHLLSSLGYRIIQLPPCRHYLCKNQLALTELQKFGEDHPALNSTSSTETRPLDHNQESNKMVAEEEDNEVVIKEIYMGPNPTLAYQSVDGDGIRVSVWISTKPEEFTTCDLHYIKDNNATIRTLKRANWILDAVHQELVITDIYRLHKAIQAQDKEEGYNVKADRKSFQRIYTRLVRGGHIKVLQIYLKCAKMKRMVTVLCDPSLDVHHSIIESVIEQFKMKFFIVKKREPSLSGTHTPVTEQVQVPTFETSQVSRSVCELKMLIEEETEFKYSRNSGREYGYMPKFVRMRTLHELLFYLIYNSPQGQQVTDVAEMFREFNVSVDENDLEEMPPIYCREVGWKMFIPPIPCHAGWSEGWALVCDVLLRLPLVIFVKLCNVSYIIPDLFLYLEHPFKQFYLLKHLPSQIRSGLIHKRKYLFSVHETLSRLCYIGLLQFGPQKLREKDQVFIYLNRNSSLLDTTTSSPGYHYVEAKEYVNKSFHFVSSTDVESYWYEMWSICAHTKLGLRNAVVGTYITIEHLETKAAMVEAIKPQTPDSVVMNDKGIVPGDKRGAAGLDSALWSHIKRNWIWGVRNKSSKNKGRSSILGKKRKVTKIDYNKPNTEVINCARKSRNKFVIRKVQKRVDKKERRSYDSVDKKLMEDLKQCRSEWTYEEDRLLHICKIISSFLCPNYRKQIVNYTVIRDTMHQLLSCSANKTSGACQRRISVLFGSVEQQEYLQQIAKTLTHIPYVRKYFQMFYEHVQSGMSLGEKQLKGAFVLLVAYFFKNQHKLQHIFDAINLKSQTESRLIRPSSHPIPEDNNVSARQSNQEKQAQLEVLGYESLELSARSNKTPRLYPEASFPVTESDVILDTIKSIIHSSVAGKPDDISCIYQFFRVYQSYSDDLLKSAVNDVRNSQMVIAAKRFTSKKQQHDIKGIPITTKLFHFSFYYNFVQITKFPVELFLDAHELFLGIQKHRDTLTDRTRNGLPMECCSQGHGIGLSEIATKVNTYFTVDFPKEVLILNPSITDHTELIRELALRYKKMVMLIKNGTFFRDEQPTEGNERQCNRVPMIQRFLKSWFLSGDHVEINSEIDYSFRDVLFDDENALKKSDKRHRRNAPITTEEGQKILETLNKEIHEQHLQARTEHLKTTTPASTETFENYEKKLEKLLSSKENEEATSSQSVKDDKMPTEGDNLLERYLPKRAEVVEPQMEIETIEERTGVELVQCSEGEHLGGNKMYYLLDDELSIEQIMKEMVADCLPEERKVPNPINLSRLLVTGLFPELDDDEERLERLHQHFLIVCPDTNLILDNFENNEELSYLHLEHPLVCKRLLRKVQKDIILSDALPLNNEIKARLESVGCSEQDKLVVDSLIDFISKKHVLGATVKELKKHFSNWDNAKLVLLLTILIDMNVILRTGIIYNVFVYYKHRKSWLVESCTLEDKDRQKLKVSKDEESQEVDLPTLARSLDSYTEIKLHIRPWARIDGTLNLRIFEKWLCTMLGYCLAEASMLLSSIIAHCCYLKPVDIYYLLECLQEIGCVKLMTYKPYNCSLLSEVTHIESVPATILDEFEDIYIETDKLAILKFGTLLNKKSKDFDFPTDIAEKHSTF
ncbi:hypothetical protein RI129_003886 [Pyrocoelia pectoralis]|uniref:B-block binding subunit of TFIIIC domain-containing protein n=1 Tax=Pyrocoelia pectoralis TaxID=417401 RepID=A0AAN7VSV6_9COLE